MCIQRIIKLIEYCIDPSASRNEICERAIIECSPEVVEFSRAFLTSKREVLREHCRQRAYFAQGAPLANPSAFDPPLPPTTFWPTCTCPFDRLMVLIARMQHHPIQPPSLASLARERLCSMFTEAGMAYEYLDNNCLIEGRRCPRLRDMALRSCMGSSVMTSIPRVEQRSSVRGVNVIDPIFLDCLASHIPNNAACFLFAPELDKIMFLKSISVMANPVVHMAGQLQVVCNTVALDDFIQRDNNRSHGPFGPLCCCKHEDYIYLRTMYHMNLHHRNQ